MFELINFFVFSINLKKVKLPAAVDDSESIKLCTLSEPTSSSSLRDGPFSDFQIPSEVVQHSCDFDSIILILSNIKCADNVEKFYSESQITERQREKAMERDAEVTKMREQMEFITEENAKTSIETECCKMLKAIGPPWNWLHNFASHNCHFKSYNFLEQTKSIHSDITPGGVNDNDDVNVDDPMADAVSVEYFLLYS